MIQKIPSLLPCLRASDLRSLGNGIMAGDSRTPGAVADGTEIEEGVRYVVRGTGTIGYNSNTFAVGRVITGVSGQTSFTRSAATALLIKTKGNAVPASGLNASDYIVSGTAANSLEYPSVDGRRYSPGDIFRGSVGVKFEATDQSTIVYEIDDNPLITSALAVHHIGSVTFPNTLDYSSALGDGSSDGAAVSADRLSMIALWNFGQAAATVTLKAYIPPVDSATGARRRDVNINMPVGGHPYVFWPTDAFRQGGSRNSFGATDADRNATQNSFVFQTSNTDIWILPILTVRGGFQ